jgi:NAD(P)-dependent dehydrogenase (short-subunit alcohol dehydrogenase family)
MSMPNQAVMNDEQVTVVTGAAGGMGRAIAHAFAEQGRPLILCDLHAGPLEAVATELGETTRVELAVGDVSDPAYPAALLAKVGARNIGVLAHAAGVSPSMTSGERIFDINFSATKRLVEGLLPSMAAGGAIILIASNSGQLTSHPILDRALKKYLAGRRSLIVDQMRRRPQTAYATSKRAVQLYAQTAARACGRAGVRIVSLSPGIIDTDMGRLEEKAGPAISRMIELAPIGRQGRADEIASVVKFLASPAASYITGTDILVDGGAVASIMAAGGAMKALRGRRQTTGAAVASPDQRR